MSKVNAYLNTLYYQEFQHQYVGHFLKIISCQATNIQAKVQQRKFNQNTQMNDKYKIIPDV